jgi:hypothetical protein
MAIQWLSVSPSIERVATDPLENAKGWLSSELKRPE